MSAVCPFSVRVSIGAKKGGPFNSTPTDGIERVRRFEQLLTGPVGEGLCRMYASYWQPAGMARYLEEAALYSKDHKSTVSITDSVSSTCDCIPLMNCTYKHTVHVPSTMDVMATLSILGNGYILLLVTTYLAAM